MRDVARLDTVDVAVVGAGSYGAATAFHLAARGLRVALLDRTGVATQTTRRPAGLAVQVYADEHLSRLPLPGDVWVFTGCNVAGLGPSPAIGEDIATWIATGERPATLAAFGLDRFGSIDEGRLRDETRAAYAGRYREVERRVG